MKIFSTIISIILLLLATRQDINEKKIYIIYPIIMFCVNIIIRVYTTGNIINILEILFSLGIIVYAVISNQKLGLGDAFIMVALLPLCNIYGVIRIYIDGLLMLFTWKSIQGKKENLDNCGETAFVPFITAGFGLWLII